MIAFQPTPSPLSLLPHLPERSSPPRVSLRRAKSRALDRSGPFRTISEATLCSLL